MLIDLTLWTDPEVADSAVMAAAGGAGVDREQVGADARRGAKEDGMRRCDLWDFPVDEDIVPRQELRCDRMELSVFFSLTNALVHYRSELVIRRQIRHPCLPNLLLRSGGTLESVSARSGCIRDVLRGSNGDVTVLPFFLNEIYHI